MLVCLALQIMSCSDWLDVSPRAQIESGENFENEEGYKDALTGIYLLMTDESLYGKDMTYGMVDVLAQYYTGITGTSQSYYYALQFDYADVSNVTRINAIWKNMYNVIANLNELIAHIDNADPNKFTGRNYHLIRGEAYGLRAFLHFDLLRLFGKSFAAGAGTLSIPYMTGVTASVSPQSTVSEVLEKIQMDLKEAESELAVDPVKDGNEVMSTDDEVYQSDRTFKFNYYAVKLLQARAYLYAQNYTEAAKAAQAIINQQTFVWVTEAEISSYDTNSRNYVGAEELVFCLYMGNLSTLYTSTFTELNGFCVSEAAGKLIYEEAVYQKTDFRWLYQMDMISSSVCIPAKLKQPASGRAEYLNRLPLMRISEAYYIAAECAMKGENADVEAAVEYLNKVRSHRGLATGLPKSLTVEEVTKELDKEYTKEFYCEGQLFFYFKRNDRAAITVYSNWGYTYTTTPKYVFPLPDDELEYGDREQAE